jgi:hypothetical protein
MAELMKRWSTGDQRPENGAFAGFRFMDKQGKMVLPKYY